MDWNKAKYDEQDYEKIEQTSDFAAAVGRALRRSASVARETPRVHATPIYIWRDGKIVAEKP